MGDIKVLSASTQVKNFQTENMRFIMNKLFIPLMISHSSKILKYFAEEFKIVIEKKLDSNFLVNEKE